MPIIISVKPERRGIFGSCRATVKRMDGVYSDEVVAPEYQLNRIRSVSARRKLGYASVGSWMLRQKPRHFRRKNGSFWLVQNL